MVKSNTKESSNESFSIPKKAMLGIAPAIAIIAVLLSKHKAPEVLLFIVGITLGFLIAKGYYQK